MANYFYIQDRAAVYTATATAMATVTVMPELKCSNVELLHMHVLYTATTDHKLMNNRTLEHQQHYHQKPP